MRKLTETELRAQICHIGRLMHQFQYADGTSGNISARLGENRFLVTPSGLAKGFMQPEHLLIINAEGQRVDNPTPLNESLRPTSEIAMHLEVYRQREDVGGVVHAHPSAATALTIAGISIQDYTLPESIILMGDVPTTPYATPSGDENRAAIQGLIAQHDAILLAYHGSLTVGTDVWAAYMLLETLEHTAHIIALAHSLGGGQKLPAHQIAKLRGLGNAYSVINPMTLRPPTNA